MTLADLTPKQLHRLAAELETTYGSLRSVKYGRRGVSAKRAIEIERGAQRMGVDLPREELNAGCAMCEFAKVCRGAVSTSQVPLEHLPIKRKKRVRK